MVSLIGVDHIVQYTNDYSDKSLIKSFSQYLVERAKQLKITLMAEEFNKEVLLMSNATACTARDVAEDLGIEHRFCDPTSSEREQVGIPSQRKIKEQLGFKGLLKDKEKKRVDEEESKYHLKREQFWLDKIRDKAHEPIIFICGDNHLESFKALLINKGFEVTILGKNWGKKQADQSCK